MSFTDIIAEEWTVPQPKRWVTYVNLKLTTNSCNNIIQRRQASLSWWEISTILCLKQKRSLDNRLQGMVLWVTCLHGLKEEYSTLRTEFVLNQSSVMIGLFFQDNEMRSTFSLFPHLLLCDATHKTNVNGMPFYALLVVDGKGDSQVVAAFLWNRRTNNQ